MDLQSAGPVDSVPESGVVRLLKAHEPRLDIRPDREMVAVMGAANISTRRYAADTGNAQQVIWNQTTPSIRVGVDRTIEIDMTWTCEVTGPGSWTASGGTSLCLTTNNAGFRQYPLHSIMENLQLRLNDQAFNWEPADVLHALLHYGNTWEDRQYKTGSSPHYPDQFWRYDETSGSARGEFSTWRAQGIEDNRRLGLWAEIVPGSLFKKIKFRLIEQLMISPLNWGEDKQCLFGIQNIDVALTFRSNLERLFAGKIKDMISNATEETKLEFSLDPKECYLHLTYLQPQANQVVPSRLNYEYYQIRKFQQSIDNLVKPKELLSQSGNIVYNNITLHEIPKRMYIYAAPNSNVAADPIVEGDFKQNRQTLNSAQCDFFARINKLSINFDSQDGRLSTLDSYDLWKMSSKNGLTKSFQQWSKTSGSVLCVEFGKDMNLNPLLAPGVRGNFQLSLDVEFQDIRDQCVSSLGEYVDPNDTSTNLKKAKLNDISLEAKKYTAYLVIVPVGVVTIDNQLITTSIGSVTEENIYQAPWMAAGTRVEYSGIHGGSLKSVANLFSKGAKAAKAAMPIIGPLVGQMAGDMLSKVNDPRAAMMGQVLHGTSKAMGRGGRSSGGRKTGGTKVRSASLARRM